MIPVLPMPVVVVYDHKVYTDILEVEDIVELIEILDKTEV
jgi:hypothetical protein